MYKRQTYDLYEVIALDSFTALLFPKDGEIAYETYQHGDTSETRGISMSVAILADLVLSFSSTWS